MRRLPLLLILVLGITSLFGIGIGNSWDDTKPTPFAAFVEDYFDAYFLWKPSEGTGVGLHQYDDKLEDHSATAVARRIEAVKKLQKRLGSLRAGKLSADDAIDAEVLAGQLGAELLDLEVIGNWHKNPMGYVGTPGSAIDGLMKRDFAPAADRLRSVIARLKAVPGLLQSMRANMKNPPKEFTDLSITMADGSIGFFRDSVRQWAKEAAGANADLLREFDAANGAVVKSLKETATWLREELLPRSTGELQVSTRG